MADVSINTRVDGVEAASLPLAERQTIVSRFEQRVDEAVQSSAPTRDWVRRALHRQGGPRCPVRLKRLSLDIIIRYGDQLADLFCRYPDDIIHLQPYEFSIGYQPPESAERIDPLRVLTESADWTDEWGTRWGHRTGGVGATPVDVPIKNWSQLVDYLTHHTPDPDLPGRLDAVKPLLAMHGTTKYCVGVIHLALFERYHCLRGMENAFLDLYTNESEAQRLLEALADYLLGFVRLWGGTPVSALFLCDDWGSQNRLMISVEMWRKFFKPHYRRVFDEIHRLGKDIIFHSCGNVMGIIPELIELGVDVLDPVQPGAMEIAQVGRQFGGQISFCGGIDDQRLEAYTPEEIRQVVRRTIDTLGTPFGNAYIGAPANLVPPTVPFENLAALVESFHDA